MTFQYFISIIVLLILAGVTIAAITVNENVLDKAQSAKSQTDVANAKEAATLKATEYIQDYYQGKYVDNDSNVTSYSTPGAYVAKQFETQTQSGNYYIKTDANSRDLKISLDASQSNVIVEGEIADDGTITWGDETGVTPGSQEPETPVATIPEKLQVEVKDENGTTTSYKKIYVNYTFPGDSEATKCIVMYSDAEHGLQIIPENPIVKVKLGKTDNIGAYGYPTTTNGSYYWLASRNVISNSYTSDFSVRIVNSSGSLDYDSLWYVTSSGNTYAREPERGFRPVILLKSGVQVKEETGMDGSEADKAYNLELAS